MMMLAGCRRCIGGVVHSVHSDSIDRSTHAWHHGTARHARTHHHRARLQLLLGLLPRRRRRSRLEEEILE